MSCSGAKKSYSDLDELYSDFVETLREKDIPELYDYCIAIQPSQETIDYMKETGFSYRGLPNAVEGYLKENNLKLSDIEGVYFEHVLAFRNSLLKKGKLKDLKYIGREHNNESIHDKALGVYYTETFILMESKGDTIKCKLGEMLRINNEWKTFTQPKLGW